MSDEGAIETYYQRNRDKMKLAAAEWRKANPEAHKAYMKDWRAKNKAKKALHDKTYYERHKEEIKAKVTKWYYDNHEYGLAVRKAYYNANRTSIIAQQQERRNANPEWAKAKRRQDYERHEARYKERAKIWRETNPERATANRNAWKEANWGLVLAHCAAQRADKLQRIPTWADFEEIDFLYENCPEGYHVDHIYPMRGKTVSGLHVANNLRFSTKAENLSKSNKIPTPAEVAEWDTEMEVWRTLRGIILA